MDPGTNFDPLPRVQKSKLGQTKKYTPRIVPKDVRNTQNLGWNAFGYPHCRPKVPVQMSKICIFAIFVIFDPLPQAKKWKLGQIKKYTPRILPKDVRITKKLGRNAIRHQHRRPKLPFQITWKYSKMAPCGDRWGGWKFFFAQNLTSNDKIYHTNGKTRNIKKFGLNKLTNTHTHTHKHRHFEILAQPEVENNTLR